MIIEKLRTGCKRLSLDLEEKQLLALETYVDCVLDFNKTYNLMKAENADEMAVNHLLDSLAALPHIQALDLKKTSLGDIGSGGGCPGIPLAVALPDFKVTLVERMEKRCDFLKNTLNCMNLQNVEVLCAQADSVLPHQFDVAVFRAFHPFDKKIGKTLLRLLKQNGYLVAYKARSEKIQQEMSTPEVKSLFPQYKKIPLTVPFLEDHERNLVVIQVSST